MTSKKSNAYSADRVPLAAQLPLASPFSLYVFPSNACNFKCTYCAHYLNDDELFSTYGVRPETMSLETMDLIVRQSKEFEQYKLITFVSQGEPLVNKNLPKMIKAAADANLGKRYEIISNASLLTNEYSDELIESGLTNLRVSLQGLDSESYEKTCGVAVDFDLLFDRLKYFYEHKKPDMGLFVKIMDVALPNGNADEFYKRFDGFCDRMSVEYVQPVYHAVDVKNQMTMMDRYGTEHKPRFSCPFPFYQLCVWPDGDVHPCDAIYKGCSIGNVHETTLREIWNGEKLRDFRLSQLQNGYKQIKACENCCAPNDCINPLDVLDDYKENLIDIFK
jgi:radical SAM protein with 4Fe4S-binding SPASM domain